jgi:3'-phosphoadenosine 5'-phosphosulfate sulfotransferase (PAPS reductase)/FAD synthetase
MDTGCEERRTLDYVRDVLPGVLGMPVTWLRADVPLPTDPDLAAVVAECEAILGWESAMVRLVVKKGVFPLRQMKWCTDLMKTQPFFEWLLTSFPATPVAFATGVRAEESAARRDMPEFSPLFRTDTSVTARWRPLVPLVLQWRPLIRWTFDDVIAIHKRHGISPNPLYLEGAERVGCWPCIHARKDEIRRISSADSARVKVIRILEAAATRVATDRADRRGRAWLRDVRFGARTGETWPRPPRLTLQNPPAFFQSRSGNREDGRHDGRCMPIDEVIEWSMTSRGGRQFELFAPSSQEAGCMRWGMCDTSGTR